MSSGKTSFGIGLVIGILIAVIFLYYFAPRYSTIKSGEDIIKQDKWSGDSWELEDGQWKKMMNFSRDWEKIDNVLMDVLHLPREDEVRSEALTLLRQKDPILSDLSDQDLLERIKLVYSKEILVNMYLTAIFAS